MKFNQDEQHIKGVLEGIETPEIENLHEKVNQRLHHYQPYKARCSLKLTLATSLCCCLIFMMAFEHSSHLRKLIGLIGYEVYSFLQPIQLADESNGIRLEVLGAMNDDESAIIYLTLQDLTGEIIDETLDIYNYTLSKGSAFFMEAINFDTKTKTATLRLQGNGGKDINGKEVMLGIQSFLTKKQRYQNYDVLPDWSILKTHQAKSILLEGHVSPGGDGEFAFNEDRKVLKPRELNLQIDGLDFVQISNIGFIDDKLHIQLEWSDNNVADHARLYLVNQSTQEVANYYGNITFGVDVENNIVYGRNIDEYVFDISPDELNELKLQGDIVHYGEYTEGDWNVKFKLESTIEEVPKKVSLKIDETLVNEVSVSALGVTLRGIGDENSPEVNILFNNGEILESDSMIGTADHTVDNSGFAIKMLFPSLLELSEIRAIQVNDHIIFLDKEE